MPVPDNGNEHLRMLQILSDLNPRDRHESQSRILQLSRKQPSHLALYLMIDPSPPLSLQGAALRARAGKRRDRTAQTLSGHRFGRDELRGERLDDVALLEVRIPRNLHAALERLGNFLDIVLEAA